MGAAVSKSLAAPALGREALRPPVPLRVRAIWAAFWREPWSFKLTCIYVFFEYVRPQQVYSSLEVLPWSKITIAAAIGAFLIEGRGLRSRTIANWLLLGMLAVVLLSSVFAYNPEYAFGRLIFFTNWLIAFFLIANTATDERKVFLFVALFLLWSTKMSQFAARSFLLGGGSSGGAPGWFQNTGEFALQMCIFVPLSFHFILGLKPMLSRAQIWLLALLPVTGTLGIINSGSRGGVLGFACVCLWMFFQSRRKFRSILALLLVVPLVWVLIPQDQKDRFSRAGEDETSLTRLTYWKRGIEMANTHPVLGVGYENWVPYYVDHYPPEPGEIVRYSAPGQLVVEVSHNIFVEIVSQLGYSGLFLFTSLILSVWLINRRTRRLLRKWGGSARFLIHLSFGLDAGTVGFVVAGFFMAVALNPFIWFQLAMTAALHTAALRASSSPRQPERTPVKRQFGYRRAVVGPPM